MEMQQPQQGRQLETSGVNLAAAVFLIGKRDEIKKSERPHWTLRLVRVAGFDFSARKIQLCFRDFFFL